MTKIYIVGTPIGNLKDITLRALETLKNVDLIACEDTRVSAKLLNHFNIKNPLIKYSKINEDKSATFLINKIKNDNINIALISDAGMPLINDPGFDLVKQARDNNIEIEIIPGVSASTTAFAWSGLSNKFVFEGFPNEKKNKRILKLKEINNNYAYIYFVAPHKLITFLEDIKETFEDKEHLFLAKELTKMHEQYFEGNAKSILDILKTKSIKGEYTLIIKLKNTKKNKINKYANLKK